MKKIEKIVFPLLAPSILSADFSVLKNEIQDLDSLGAQWIHWDIMDGNFVPNLSLSSYSVRDCRKHSSSFFDCHLMVRHPKRYIKDFAQSGADLITFHIEAEDNPVEVIHEIRSHDLSVGIALKPKTPLSAVTPFLSLVDLVLVMSVEPGFGGQKFLDETFEKVKELKSLQDQSKFLLQVDGGIGRFQIEKLSKIGVQVYVVGSSLVGQKDRSVAWGALCEVL